MECFEVIKTVLDELYNEMAGTDTQKDDLIHERLAYLSDAYKDLTRSDRPAVEYRDPVTRFAYIYKYVTSHANIVYDLLGEHKPLQALFKRESVDVTCVGGGPGSDFLGILKYMQAVGAKSALKCYLFDGEPAWGESWADVDQKVSGCEFRISTIFQVFDVTIPDTYEIHRKCLKADLFTVIYFVSEVYRQRQEARAFFDNLFSSAESGSLLLFVDNARSEFYGWFDDVARKHGMAAIASQLAQATIGVDEDKEALGIYYTKFGWPKMKTQISYRLWQKP